MGRAEGPIRAMQPTTSTALRVPEVAPARPAEPWHAQLATGSLTVTAGQPVTIHLDGPLHDGPVPAEIILEGDDRRQTARVAGWEGATVTARFPGIAAGRYRARVVLRTDDGPVVLDAALLRVTA